MLSTRSYYKTILRSDWRRLWPMAALYALVWFFAMPMMVWQENHWDIAPKTLQASSTVYQGVQVAVVVCAIFGVLMAMGHFNYLMQSRAVGLMHALPATRRTQFVAHFLSGMSLFTLINVFTALLTLLMEIRLNAVDMVPILTWFGCTELLCLFFFCFGILCAMATGWLLAIPVIYVGLNFVMLAAELLLRVMAESYYWGTNFGSQISRFTQWCTPTVNLMDEMIDSKYNDELRYSWSVLAEGSLKKILIYAAVGVLMLVFAWVLYKHRHSETAGEAIVFGWLQPVVETVISVVSGIALGILTVAMLGCFETFFSLAIFQILFAAVMAMVVEMLLQKRYRIFKDKRAWTRVALSVGLMAVILVCFKLDVLGCQRRVPDVDQVKSVEITNSMVDVTVSDQAAVEKAVALHQAILRAGERTWDTIEENNSRYVSIVYYMKDDTALYRNYTYDITDIGIYDAQAALMNHESIKKLRLIRINNYGEQTDTTEFRCGYINCYSEEYGLNTEIDLTAEQCQNLYEAMIHDSMYNLPEDYDRWVDLRVDVSLELKDGGWCYLERLYPSCTATLDLLKEYGAIKSVEDIYYSPYYSEEPFAQNTDPANFGVIGGEDGPAEVFVTQQ